MINTTIPSATEALTQAAHDADCLFRDLREAYRCADPLETLVIEPLLTDVNTIRTRIDRLIEARRES